MSLKSELYGTNMPRKTQYKNPQVETLPSKRQGRTTRMSGAPPNESVDESTLITDKQTTEAARRRHKY